MAHAMQLLIFFHSGLFVFCVASLSRVLRHPLRKRRSVVIYPLVIRSIFARFPFWKGKNEGKQMNIKGKRNDTTVTADTKN